MKRIVRRALITIWKCAYYGLRWLFVTVFRKAFYDDVYFTTSWFKGIKGDGWSWAAVDIWNRLIHRRNLGIRWPVSPRMDCGEKIIFAPEDVVYFQATGCYFQTYGEFDTRIIFGRGCYIAKNVGIITTNHDIRDPDKHVKGEDVVIGDHSWLGMNSMVLPNVKLGPHTVVGAGAVVTKSFPEGHCVIAGNPARMIKKIEKEDI